MPETMRDTRSLEDVISVLRGWAAACRSHSYPDALFMQGLRAGNLNAADGYEEVATALSAIASGDQSPRSWSLPAPPPDDVTVVHVQAGDEVRRFVRAGYHWCGESGSSVYGFGELLDMGTVVEGEPPAPAPFDVDARVRVKASGRIGVVREVDSRGRHLIFGDDGSWITGLTADRLELVATPVFERGFYRLTRDLTIDVRSSTVEWLEAGSVVSLHHVEGDCGLVWHPSMDSTSCRVELAAFAAAGAERVEDHE